MLVFAALVPLLMHLRLRTLQRVLRLQSDPVRIASAVDAEEILRHFHLARRVGAPFVRANCLTRGMTLCYFLRRAGIDVTLSFGIGRVAGELRGHCWLCRVGTPFLEEPDPRSLYVEFVSLPIDDLRSGSAGERTFRDLSCP